MMENTENKVANGLLISTEGVEYSQWPLQMTNCLICATPVAPKCKLDGEQKLKMEEATRLTVENSAWSPIGPNRGDWRFRGEDFFVEGQLKSIFIMRALLQISSEKLGEFLKWFHGNSQPEYWVNLCLPCEKSVYQFYQIWKLKHTEERERKMFRIWWNLKLKVLKTKNAPGGTLIWKSIRDAIPETYPFNPKFAKVPCFNFNLHAYQKNYPSLKQGVTFEVDNKMLSESPILGPPIGIDLVSEDDDGAPTTSPKNWRSWNWFYAYWDERFDVNGKKDIEISSELLWDYKKSVYENVTWESPPKHFDSTVASAKHSSPISTGCASDIGNKQYDVDAFESTMQSSDSLRNQNGRSLNTNDSESNVHQNLKTVLLAQEINPSEPTETIPGSSQSLAKFTDKDLRTTVNGSGCRLPLTVTEETEQSCKTNEIEGHCDTETINDDDCDVDGQSDSNSDYFPSSDDDDDNDDNNFSSDDDAVKPLRVQTRSVKRINQNEAERTKRIHTVNMAKRRNGKAASTSQRRLTRKSRHFKCPKCKKPFRDNCGLKRHFGSMHPEVPGAAQKEKPFKCEPCKLWFRDKSGLDRHMGSSRHDAVKPFKCDYCTESFGRKDHLDKHVIRSHPNFLSVEKKKRLQKWTCKVCQRIFDSGSHFQRHLKFHTGPRKFRCDYCKTKVESTSLLIGHLKEIHKKTGKYICEECGASFTTISGLTKHQHIKHS